MNPNPNHHRQIFSWSDLPPELLKSIADRLNANSDHLQRFRSVCKNWRSSIPPPLLCLNPSLPHIIPETSGSIPFNDSGRPFLIVSTAVYLLRPRRRRSSGAGGCWLIGVEQFFPFKVRLLHPLTGLPLENLPENFPKKFSNFSALEISRGINLRFYDGSLVLQDKLTSFCMNKVLLWPNPNLEDPGIGDSSLLVLHNTGDLNCLRLSDIKDRRAVNYASGCKFDDIVNWKGFILAVDRVGRLYGIEYNTRKVVTVLVAIPIVKGSYDKRKRLLVSDGEIYLLVRDSTTKLLNFKVYTLNEKQYEWEEVVSLGDRVLFVSFDTCFFAQARDLPGFGGNCIVYPRGCFPSYTSNGNPDDAMFRGVPQYLEVGVYKYGDNGRPKSIWLCPEYSDVFWPPPSWIFEEAALSQWEYDDKEIQMDFPGHHASDVSCVRVASALEAQGRKQTDNPSSNPSTGLAAEEQHNE